MKEGVNSISTSAISVGMFSSSVAYWYTEYALLFENIMSKYVQIALRSIKSLGHNELRIQKILFSKRRLTLNIFNLGRSVIDGVECKPGCWKMSSTRMRASPCNYQERFTTFKFRFRNGRGKLNLVSKQPTRKFKGSKLQ